MYKLLVFLLFIGAPLMAQEVFKEHLYSPDLILKYREKIDLTDEQAKKVKDTYNASVMSYNNLKWDLDAKMVALEELLSSSKVDVGEAEASLQEMLALENEIKKLRLAAMLRIKNILTPEQQRFLDDHKSESTKGYEITSSVNEDPRVVVRVSGQLEDNQPLYIIKNGEVETEVKSLKSYDPDQIESIEVLKGESATKIYGDRGKNGVVIVRFK